MKNSQLDFVAKQVGVSPSAVSKAVNHCPGLGSELREQILTAAHTQGVRGKKVSQVDLYVIQPETPTYFWARLFDTLCKEIRTKKLSAKVNVYSRMGDDAVVERYLLEAEQLNAKAVMIAANTCHLAQRLEEIAKERAVFSLIEPVTAKNVFFFGSDRCRDGAALSRRLCADLPRAKEILLIGRDPLRHSGFAAAAPHLILHDLCTAPGELQKKSAAELARAIDSLCKETSLDAAVCFDGVTDKVRMALKKCHLALPCYGFEHPPTEERYALPGAEVCQDVEAIALAAVEAAERYLKDGMFPDRKETFLPAKLVTLRR